MFSSKVVQFGLAIQIIMLLINSSLLMPITSPISNSTDNVNATTVHQSTAESSLTTTESSSSAIASQESAPIEMNNCTCTRISTSSCTSLQDAIFTVINQLRDIDTPYQFFTLRDLFYSAILDDRQRGYLQGPPLDGTVDLNSERERQLTQRRCNDLMARYNLPTKDTDSCTWSYTCTQNQLQFPSFHIEAVLDESSPGVCNKVKTFESRRFLKTQCQQDASRVDWLDCHCKRTVIGFKRA